jgi:hypothetical protein
MHVGHSILDNPAYRLQPFPVPHGCYGVTLHKNKSLRQQLKSLERASVRPKNPLPPLHEAVLVRHEVPYLDYVASNVVLEDFEGLRRRDRSGQQLDKISGVEYGGGVVCLQGSEDRHATLGKVQLTSDALFCQGGRYDLPACAEVLFTILGKQGRETRLLCEGASSIILGLERVDLPFVDVVRVPRFLGVVCRRHRGKRAARKGLKVMRRHSMRLRRLEHAWCVI